MTIASYLTDKLENENCSVCDEQTSSSFQSRLITHDKLKEEDLKCIFHECCLVPRSNDLLPKCPKCLAELDVSLIEREVPLSVKIEKPSYNSSLLNRPTIQALSAGAFIFALDLMNKIKLRSEHDVEPTNINNVFLIVLISCRLHKGLAGITLLAAARIGAVGSLFLRSSLGRGKIKNPLFFEIIGGVVGGILHSLLERKIYPPELVSNVSK